VDGDSDNYVDADGDGLFRLSTTRKWKLALQAVDVQTGNEIRVPQLAAGLSGTLNSERFVDMDLIPIESNVVLLKNPTSSLQTWLAGIALAIALLAMCIWLFVRSRKRTTTNGEDGLRMPDEVTPFSAIMTLRRYSQRHANRLSNDERSQLDSEINQLEQRFFAAESSSNGANPSDVLTFWNRRLAGRGGT
jgi:hypothetical protein